MKKFTSTYPMATTAIALCSAMYWRLTDGRADQVAHARDAEEELDDHCAADERSDLQAGHGQQGEAGRPQRMAPQHPPVGDALRPSP